MRRLPAVVLIACSVVITESGVGQSPSSWALSREPRVSVGTLADDSLYELNRAESAILLTTGEIVVANRGSFQLRWYDARGKYLRSVGRRGQGPQEFRALYVFEAAGDSILVQDDINRRRLQFTSDGKFLGIDSSGSLSRETWLYDGYVASRLPVTADLAKLRSLLLKLPREKDAPLQSVLVDRAGNVWVRAASDSSRYVVYDGSARRVAQVQLPPRFEIYQALDTLVLGRYRDEDGVEAIQVRRLTKGGVSRTESLASSSVGSAYDEAAEIATHRETVAGARAFLRNLLTAQEMHHAKEKRYARSLKDLGGLQVPPNVELTLIAPTPNAYWLVAELKGTRLRCVVGVGSVVHFGFVEACG